MIMIAISCGNDCPSDYVYIQTSILASPLKVAGKKVKSAYKPSGPSVWSLPGLSSMKQLGVFLLPPWMGCRSIAGLPPAFNSPVPIFTLGWREAL